MASFRLTPNVLVERPRATATYRHFIHIRPAPTVVRPLSYVRILRFDTRAESPTAPERDVHGPTDNREIQRHTCYEPNPFRPRACRKKLHYAIGNSHE